MKLTQGFIPSELFYVGDNNIETLTLLAKNAGVIIGAWGNDGVFLNRSRDVRALIPELCILKVNKSGEPTHSLYLQTTLTLIKVRIE